MKKNIIILLLITGSTVFGQTKKEIITQNWKLNKVEEFGQEYDLTDNQKKDLLTFTANGKFTGIIEGNHVEGTWSVNGEKVVVSFNKKLSKTKVNWAKVKVLEKEKFALEYQDGDLITSTLLFIPNK